MLDASSRFATSLSSSPRSPCLSAIGSDSRGPAMPVSGSSFSVTQHPIPYQRAQSIPARFTPSQLGRDKDKDCVRLISALARSGQAPPWGDVQRGVSAIGALLQSRRPWKSSVHASRRAFPSQPIPHGRAPLATALGLGSADLVSRCGSAFAAELLQGLGEESGFAACGGAGEVDLGGVDVAFGYRRL